MRWHFLVGIEDRGRGFGYVDNENQLEEATRKGWQFNVNKLEMKRLQRLLDTASG